MKIFSLLLFLLFVTFSLGEISQISLGNGIAVTANDIVVALIVFGFLLFKKNLFVPLKKHIGIFVGVCIVSLFVNSAWLRSDQIVVASLYLVRFVLYFLICAVAYNYEKKQHITLGMTLVGAVITFIGFVQYVFYNDLRNLYYLGWDDHKYRLFSSFLDPNFAGAFLVLYLLLLLHQIFSTSSKKRIYLVVFALFTLIAIFLTFSRSAILTLLLSSTVLLWLLGKKKIIAIVVVSLFVFLSIVSRYTHIENMNLLRTASSEARVATAKEAITIVKGAPVLGVGFNAYRYALISYGFRDTEKTKKSNADAGADNSFLFLFATTGLVGFFSFCALFYEGFKQLRKTTKPSYYSLCIASVVAIVVNAQFINSLFYPFILEWLWLLLGVGLYYTTARGKQ